MLESGYKMFQDLKNLGISNIYFFKRIFVLFHEASVSIHLPIKKNWQIE